MFVKCEEGIFYEVHKGVSRKTTVYGEKMLQYKYYLEKGADVPIHKHPSELAGYLVSGLLQLFINGKTYRVEPGDSWYVPSKVKHGAKVLEDTVVIEVFSLVREDFLTRIAESAFQFSIIPS